MKLSNTIQHLTGGVIFAFACLILLINLSVSARVCVGWSLIGFWLCVTIGWEVFRYLAAAQKTGLQNQKDASEYANSQEAQAIHGSGSKAYNAYWKAHAKDVKINWLDTIADLLAGNIPVWLLCIVGMYGQSIVGVMR